MIKKIYQINEQALMCDFGENISKKINSNVISIFNYINNKIIGDNYERRKRTKGKSKYKLIDIFNSFFEVVVFPFSDFPLKFAFFFGFLSFIICMFVMFRTLFLHFSGASSQLISTTSIFVAILFFHQNPKG